jgi:energy-coupling factor transporter transmembrane protein EcfT
MENPVILFEEIQSSGKTKNKWFSGIIALIFAIALLFNHFSGKEMPVFSGFLWGGFIVFIFLQILASASFQLITQIREDGVYVRFPPYQTDFRRFGWEDIEEIHVRKFNPGREYGYGVKKSPNGYGYTVPGDTGIYILLKNQSSVMISTEMSEEIIMVLKKMGRVK